MTFQVYYRKWRPQRFSDLVGQEHVSSTLLQAVQQGRVAHSYLFCGPRGTGKTSTARLLAKAVNCLDPMDGGPCNGCVHCLSINEGRFMDLIELDAASNRGIDEIRNIRDRVNLAPAEGGHKVYIIDESHMLTEHASNAFLKTLEEPPAHAIFILCTTEPHKILPTIISRCQRFDFRRLTSDVVVERLRGICLEEGVTADGDALRVIARSAGGSLRDAENLLEQLVVSYGNRAGIEEVYDLLGLGQGEGALEFVRYVLMQNTSAALAAINRAAWDGADLRQMHRQALELLRGVLMLQHGARESLDLPAETVRDLEEVVPKTSPSTVMKALKLLGELNMKYDSSSPLPLELAVVEICMEEVPQTTQMSHSPSASPLPTAPPESQRAAPVQPAAGRPGADGRTPSGGGAQAPASRSASSVPSRVAPAETSSPARPQGIAEVRVTPSSSPQPSNGEADGLPATGEAQPEGYGGGFSDQWLALVKTLSRHKGKRFNIGALLRDCKSQRIEGESLVLTFAHRSHLERMEQELEDPQGMKMINDAVLKSLGASYQLKLTLANDNGAASTPATTRSPLVRAALSMGARVIEERERS